MSLLTLVEPLENGDRARRDPTRSNSGWSVVDLTTAGGSVDAGLDPDAVALDGGGDLARAQVAHGALAQRQHAAVADAHAATARHEHAGILGLVEDGPVTGCLDLGVRLEEVHAAALADDQR